jgi:hypothetical protein
MNQSGKYPEAELSLESEMGLGLGLHMLDYFS